MNVEEKMPGAQTAVHCHRDTATAWMETPLDNKQVINRQEDQLLLQLNSNLLSLAHRTSSFHLPSLEPFYIRFSHPGKEQGHLQWQ